MTERSTYRTTFDIPKSWQDEAKKLGINIKDAARYGIQTAIYSSPCNLSECNDEETVHIGMQISIEMQKQAKKSCIVLKNAAIWGIYKAIEEAKKKSGN